MNKNVRPSIFRRSLAFRLLAPCVLLVVAFAGVALSQYSGGLIEFFTPISREFLKDIPEPGVQPGARRLARRVIVVVADGLAADALVDMPYVASLGRRGALFTARVETPSYSRTGYSTIAAGTGPEFSGVSSNSYLKHSRVDSVFHRARKAGLRTAFVGYDWWLDLFERDIMIASIDVGDPNKQAAPFKTPSNFIRRVLKGETYVSVPDGDWRAFKRTMGAADRFGDPADTKADEDLLRVREAARILRQENPDLLFLHLQNTDYHGHIQGGTRARAYRRAAREMDNHIRELARSVDAGRDVLILTADHGFTTANKDAGHGGYEPSVMNVPLILHGAGIIAGTRGSARQRDTASTISLLLAVPFPRMNMGRPLMKALRMTAAEKKAVRTRLDGEQKRLMSAHLRSLERPALTRSDWRVEYADSLRRMVLRTRLWNFAAAALVFALLFFIIRGMGMLPPRWYVWWLLYEIIFAGSFLLIFNVYSMSMYASLENFMQWAWGIHFASVGICLGTRIAAARFASVRAGIHDVVQAMVPGVLLKAAVVFAVLGNSALMPHGFWLFAGLAMGAQVMMGALTAIPAALYFGPRSL